MTHGALVIPKNGKVVGALYEASPGDQIRIALQDGGQLRPIFWLQVGKDGSLYLGPRYRNVKALKMGSTTAQGGVVSIDYEDGDEITDATLLKSKVSFHASGIINMAGQRSLGKSLRTIEEQEVLCNVIFQQPNLFAPIGTARHRDICLNYSLDEKRPLCGQLLAAPLGKEKAVNMTSSVEQFNIFIPFKGLEGTPDLMLQFVLYHGVEGTWPPATYLVFGVTHMSFGTAE